MSATKSGNNIQVNGTGNTLTSITADIADTTFIEETSPGVFTIKGNVARYLQIMNDGELTIGDSGDYSAGETLIFENPVDYRNRFYNYPGGTFNMYGNSVVDFGGTLGDRYMYAYMYGQCNILGDATYKPIIQNITYWWFYETYYTSGTAYDQDIWTLNNVIFGSAARGTRNNVYFNRIGKPRAHSMTNVFLDYTKGQGVTTTRGVRLEAGGPGLYNTLFDGWDFTGIQDGWVIYGICTPPVHFKNAKFGGISTDWDIYLDHVAPGPGLDLPLDKDLPLPPRHAQPFFFLDAATFYDSPTNNNIYVRGGSVVVCKDCDFQNTDGNNFSLDSNAHIKLWGTTNTFANYNNTYNSNGSVLWCYPLDLTIEDQNGNPVENAKVHIEQVDGKEAYIFYTKANGKLDAYFDIEVALLANRCQYSDSGYEYWSDGANGGSHNVTVFKDGYRPQQASFVMDQDRTDTITLDRIDARAMAF